MKRGDFSTMSETQTVRCLITVYYRIDRQSSQLSVSPWSVEFFVLLIIDNYVVVVNYLLFTSNISQ